MGLFLAAKAKDGVMEFHGYLFMIAAVIGIFALVSKVFDEPEGALVQRGTGVTYMDGVIRAGIIASMFWAVAGLLAGDFIAWQLVFPWLNLDLPWTTFGRLRPLHTSAVIFAFGGNVLIATSFHVVQRTCKARLAGGHAGWFVFWGYNLFIVIAATGYLLGVTQSKEYESPSGTPTSG